MSKSKAIGTRAESALVAFLIANGVPAKRVALSGALDQGDVHAWPTNQGARVVIEVKSGKQTSNPTHRQLQEWLAEAHREADNVPDADVAVLVTKRAGSGHGNVGQWWAHISDGDIRWMCDGRHGHDDVIVAMSVNALAFLLRESQWAG